MPYAIHYRNYTIAIAYVRKAYYFRSQVKKQVVFHNDTVLAEEIQSCLNDPTDLNPCKNLKIVLMKSNATRIFVIRTILFVLLSLYFLTVFGQPDYSFKKATLISGTALQTGAKYKFSNVKAGVDAIVTIKAQVGGITLTNIDNNTTGFDEAFQPFINVTKNANGYVEFQLDFVNTGTMIPQVQNIIPVTSIDLGGNTYDDGVLNEKDQVEFFPGNYDFTMTGTKLQLVNSAGWLVIKNASGASYPGIDTVAKDAMATVVDKNISSLLLRIGGINTSPTQSEERQRSVYFKSFDYGRPIQLPNRTMLSLSGMKKQNDVELKGVLSASHTYNKMIIERSTSLTAFSYIGEMDISGKASSTFAFTYLDTKAENGVNYYRIRLINTTGNIQETTNTLMVKMDNDNHNSLAVVNNIIQGGNAVLTIRNPETEDADLQISDMSGHMISNIKTKLYSGLNSINLSGFNINKGYFAIVVRTKNNIAKQKIIVQ